MPQLIIFLSAYSCEWNCSIRAIAYLIKYRDLFVTYMGFIHTKRMYVDLFIYTSKYVCIADTFLSRVFFSEHSSSRFILNRVQHIQHEGGSLCFCFNELLNFGLIVFMKDIAYCSPILIVLYVVYMLVDSSNTVYNTQF